MPINKGYLTAKRTSESDECLTPYYAVDRMSEWIRADDKLPEKDKSVLVYYKLADGRKRYSIAHYSKGDFSREDVWILAKDIYTCGFVLKNVLYWMPIPKLPKQENDDK